MKRKSLALVVTTLLASPWLKSDLSSTGRAFQAAPPVSATSPWRVRLTFRTGESRETTLAGVGCSQVICSRVAIRARSERESQDERPIRFDDILAIRLRGAGRATLETVDGASRHLAIPVENRTLYLVEPGHVSERLDMRELTAVEFLR